MRFGLLGPLVVSSDEHTPVQVRGLKVRTLLAALLCRPGQPVPADALFDAHLVGRSDQVHAVSAALWSAAKARRPVLGIVCGPAGSGKTTLAVTIGHLV
jgi:polynucleotide 5'-kinase involved in rRNA processing